MQNVILFTGHAGTGKTTRLIGTIKEYAPIRLVHENQVVLVMSFMHGARRRLRLVLDSQCPDIPKVVKTIDGFALSLLNKWRTALAIRKPVSNSSDTRGTLESLFHIQMSFDNILAVAAELLQKPTIRKTVGFSYPLIVVDEFQDCHGPRLEFVKSLGMAGQLLLAADDFQLLDSDVEGCPAIEWVDELHRDGMAVIEELRCLHRTSHEDLIAGAASLRNNACSCETTVPVFCCPSAATGAWKIIEVTLLPKPSRWTGVCALITPSHDSFLGALLKSYSLQTIKKNLRPHNWKLEVSAASEREQLIAELGFRQNQESVSCVESLAKPTSSPFCKHVSESFVEFAALRGVKEIPRDLAISFAERFVNARRAYGDLSSTRVITTIHGAKNREFDYVFVLWSPHTVKKWKADEQRRLLYNAVTRAKKGCMILFLGSVEDAGRDPVLSLLGTPRPVFPTKRKRKSLAKRSGSRVKSS